MAEPEEKPEGTPNEPENTPQPDSQPEGTPPAEETADWEKRYKDLQADHTRTRQRVADLETQRQEPAEELPEEGGDYYNEEGFVDRKTVNTMIQQAVSKAVGTVRMQTADSYFRKTYPDIVKHENIISGILRNPKDPDSLKGATPENRIDAAVKEFNELTEEAKTTAKTQAEAEAREREEKNRKAAGLGGPSTTPSKGDEEGQSIEEELRQRKARSAKRRGLV